MHYLVESRVGFSLDITTINGETELVDDFAFSERGRLFH